MMKGRVTADDVAKKAGVSQSTVSRVLNNYPFIKEGTREKVLEAINELGFTRDEITRSLVEKKTRTIGLIIGNISNPFFAESAGVIISKAQKEKYDVIIYNTNHDDYQLEKVNTREAAQAAVALAKYPPYGNQRSGVFSSCCPVWERQRASVSGSRE